MGTIKIKLVSKDTGSVHFCEIECTAKIAELRKCLINQGIVPETSEVTFTKILEDGKEKVLSHSATVEEEGLKDGAEIYFLAKQSYGDVLEFARDAQRVRGEGWFLIQPGFPAKGIRKWCLVRDSLEIVNVTIEPSIVYPWSPPLIKVTPRPKKCGKMACIRHNGIVHFAESGLWSYIGNCWTENRLGAVINQLRNEFGIL